MSHPGGGGISNEQMWAHLQALFGGHLPPLPSGTNPATETPSQPGAPTSNNFFSLPPLSHTISGSAPVTSLPAPLSSQLAPPIPRYQSTRSGVPNHNPPVGGGSISFAHPPLASAPPAPSLVAIAQGSQGNSRGSTQSTSANTSNANRQRLASAAARIPRQPALQPRTATAGQRRRRGPALRPPSLVTGPRLEDTFIYDPNHPSTIQAIRLRVKVYPHTQGYTTFDEYYLYRFHLDEFNRQLDSLGLLHELEMGQNTTVHDLIENITSRMANSRFAYSFQHSRRRISQQTQQNGLGGYQDLALGLLGLVNRGRPRNRDNSVRLALQPSVGLSINTLLDHGPRYARPELCVEDNRFIIHLVILRSNVSALLPPRNTGNRGPNMRRHTCISNRLYGRFPDDGFEQSSDYPGYSSGGEDDEMEVEETDGESAMSDAASQGTPTPAALEGPSQIVSAPATPPPNQFVGPAATPSIGQQEVQDTPPVLWSLPWSAPATRSHPLSPQDLDDSIFELSADTDPEAIELFEIRGENVNDLANELTAAIRQALTLNDFSRILSPERAFKIIGTDNLGHFTRSVGRGIEREAVHLAFEQYVCKSEQWFLPRAGGHSTLAMSISSGLVPMSSSPRIEKLGILGALTSLMLVYGMAPIPLSPILIHFFLHDCCFESIHAKLVAEWIPELHQTLQQWLSLDHNSNITTFQAHFATYHDIQIACLDERDLVTHKSLASDMLFKAIIGPQPATHPEFQAFLKGFYLQCKTGFNIKKINELVEGGSEAFLNVIWTSQVKSYDDLEPHISVYPAPGALIQAQLSAILNPLGFTFKGIMDAYFRGTGIPCPGLFELARGHFCSQVDLSLIDEPGFRSRMFCWATTGSPSIDVSSDGISIHISAPNDSHYSSDLRRRQSMMAEGKFCFRTCIKQVRIPLAYLEGLAASSYSQSNEPSSFQNAFDNWFLLETLNAIGSHSIM